MRYFNPVNKKTSVKRIKKRAQIIEIGKISCSFYDFDTGKRLRIQADKPLRGDKVKKGDYVYIWYTRVKHGYNTKFKKIYIKKSKYPFKKTKRNDNKSNISCKDNTAKTKPKVIKIRKKIQKNTNN